MPFTEQELDAYERARRAEINVAHGTGDEDDADHWMGVAGLTWHDRLSGLHVFADDDLEVGGQADPPRYPPWEQKGGGGLSGTERKMSP